MAALGRLGLLLSETHEPAMAGRALVDTALEFCGWDACFLLVHDSERDTVTVRAVSNTDADAVARDVGELDGAAVAGGVAVGVD